MKATHRTVLVTGSRGFVGKHLVTALLAQGHTVAGVDITTPTNGFTKGGVVPLYTPNSMYPKVSDEILNRVSYVVPDDIENCVEYICDFTDAEAFNALMRVVVPDVVYHIGAVADLNWAREHPMETVKINVDGTAVVAKACSDVNAHLNYCSTCCSYGQPQPVHPTVESAPKNPTEIYGCTKLAGEYIVKGFSSLTGMTYNIARPSTVVGPCMRPALAAWIFLDRVSRGLPIPINGKGTQTRSFIYVGDLIDGLVKLLDAPKNEDYNFAGQEETSVLTLARKCFGVVAEHALDRSYVLRFEHLPARPSDVEKEHICVLKAKRELGWEPKTTLKEALQLAWKHEKSKGACSEC